MMPMGKATSATITTSRAVPMMPWATPASSGLLDRSEVRKSTPRSAKTGQALHQLRTDEHGEDREREEQRQQERAGEDEAADVDTIAPDGADSPRLGW